MNGVIVTQSDKEILKFLFKFRVSTIDEISVFLNIKKVSAYERMRKLVRANVVITETIILEKQVYYLNEQGHQIIASNGNVVNPLKMNLLHEIFLSKVGAILLRDNNQLELNDLYTERDLINQEENFFKVSNKVFPDLYIPKYNVIIEYERTEKSRERIGNKIVKNFEEFTDCSQIWILPSTRKATIEILEKNDFYISGIIAEEYIESSLSNPQYKLDLNSFKK